MPRSNLLDAFAQNKIQPLLLGMAFALLIAISVATAFVINRAGEDADNLNQTLLVQDRLTNVLLVLRRAESGQRGFLLTRRDEYLEDYKSSAPRILPIINELRDTVGNDPTLTPIVERIETLGRTKIDEMETTITLARRGDFTAAFELIASDVGRNTMEEVRNAVMKAVADQRTVRAERSAITYRNNTVLLTLTSVGALFILLIGSLSVFLVRRNSNRAEQARYELAATNANLENLVAYRTADLTEANEEIQRFAYIVSHDLRSPLVNIMGFTSELEALRQDVFSELDKLTAEVEKLNGQVPPDDTVSQLGKDFDEAIGFIKTSIGNMDRLINAVLRLSREGRRQFNPEKVDMNALIGGIIQTVSHRAAELGANIRVEDLPGVETDMLAAQQIFTNLIDNALKYGRADAKPEIDIRGRLTVTHAIYEVQDNGRGIDRGDFQRVFELFRRAGKQDRPGEGIGLAHVRALVRRMGGNMGLESKMGKGSTFTVTLPRRWSVEKRSAA